MNYINLQIAFFLSVGIVQSQMPYNHRIENGQVQAFGKLIYELDESYLAIGRGIDTIDFLGGVYATEIDKKSGEILSNDKYTENGKIFFFNRGNSVLNIKDEPYFLFKSGATIYLSSYSQMENKIVIVKEIVSPTESNSLFINDFQYKDGIFYILSGHSEGTVMLMYDLESDLIEEFFIPEEEGSMTTMKFNFLQNGNFLLSYDIFESTGKRTINIKEVDAVGNTLWKYKNPIINERTVYSFIPMDSTTYILGGVKNNLASINPEGEQTPFILKFDYNEKTIVAKSDFGIPINEWFMWNNPVEEIVQSHDGNSFLCVAELYEFPLNYDTLTSYAMVAKVDKDLNNIWKRTYGYIEKDYSRHELEDIITTSDGNYLCHGTSQKTNIYPGEIPLLSWVFKIDEDGKIVGDTTTLTIDWEYEEYTEEISIFPNPASDMIYINQDEIEKVTYRVYDSVGKLDDEFEISSKNSSVMKDIGAWSSGMKFIQIIKDGKLIGTNKFVKL